MGSGLPQAAPPTRQTWLEQGREPAKPLPNPFRARQHGDALLSRQVPTLIRGQIPPRYLEDVLSRVKPRGPAAHHADTRSRGGGGGQPPLETWRCEGQRGRDAACGADSQARPEPFPPAQHPPRGARPPAPAMALRRAANSRRLCTQPRPAAPALGQAHGLGAYGGAGTGPVVPVGLSTAPEKGAKKSRNWDPPSGPTHRGRPGPAPSGTGAPSTVCPSALRPSHPQGWSTGLAGTVPAAPVLPVPAPPTDPGSPSSPSGPEPRFPQCRFPTQPFGPGTPVPPRFPRSRDTSPPSRRRCPRDAARPRPSPPGTTPPLQHAPPGPIPATAAAAAAAAPPLLLGDQSLGGREPRLA